MRKKVELVSAKIHRFTSFIAYVLLLLQSTPNLWTGFMTLPLILILVTLFSGIPSTYPVYYYFLDIGFPFVCLGQILLIWSTIHYIRHRKEGLVTSGPYRLMRHPQYFGSLLFSLGLTQSSIWILKMTFGLGWLSPEWTMTAWFLTLIAYIFLAYAEEYYLILKMKEKYLSYVGNTPFMFPFIKLQKRGVETFTCIVIMASFLISTNFWYSTVLSIIEVGTISFLMIIWLICRKIKNNADLQ